MSVWSDIRKSPQEIALGHPAIFPTALVQRLVECFTTPEDRVVLDPFSGSGSTLIGAMLQGKQGIGFEIAPSYVELTRSRIASLHLPFEGGGPPAPVVHREDARNLSKILRPDSIDFCMTSPPYWDILSRKRTGEPRQAGTS